MSIRLMPALLLAAFASVSFAAPPLVVLDNPPRGESTINLRQETPASCAMPSLGDCGSCAVTCRINEAAVCKPGKAVAMEAGASCLREPVCRCETAQR